MERFIGLHIFCAVFSFCVCLAILGLYRRNYGRRAGFVSTFFLGVLIGVLMATNDWLHYDAPSEQLLIRIASGGAGAILSCVFFVLRDLFKRPQPTSDESREIEE